MIMLISIQEIRDPVPFLSIYGQLYNIQNIEWCDLFLKQSYDHECS